jgi:hypothetical protein
VLQAGLQAEHRPHRLAPSRQRPGPPRTGEPLYDQSAPAAHRIRRATIDRWEPGTPVCDFDDDRAVLPLSERHLEPGAGMAYSVRGQLVDDQRHFLGPETPTRYDRSSKGPGC